jgi:hypothetical protein
MGSDSTITASGILAALVTIAAWGLLTVSHPPSAPDGAAAATAANEQLGRQPEDRRNPLTPRPVMV